MEKVKLLVAVAFAKEKFKALSEYADIYYLDELNEKDLESFLPSIDCVFASVWPRALTAEKIALMKNLKFIQSGSAGVDSFPFRHLDKKVME